MLAKAVLQLVKGGTALLPLSAAPPALAQQVEPSNDKAIIITGVRELLGVSVERTLTPDDLAVYGLGTIGDLLDEVAAENGETREDSVVLVNGERVVGLVEVEDYPAEAIDRVDVLPIGSARRVGSSATRRVYNIVLKRRVDMGVTRAALRTATEGGWTGERGDTGFTRIRGSQRINVTGRLRHESRLLESERNIEQPAGSETDLGRFRTLRPDLDGFDLKASAADRLTSWLKGSMSGSLSSVDRESLLGLTVDGIASQPLEQRSRALTGNINLALNARFGGWLVNFLGNYDHDRRRTLTDRVYPNGPATIGRSRTVATTHAAYAELVASGPLFNLPAGPARASIVGRLVRDSIRGSTRFLGITTRNQHIQWSRIVSAGIDVPIASRDQGFLSPLGGLSASAELTRTHVTGFGSFTNQTYSFQWQLVPWGRLFGLITTRRTPPAVGFTSDPIIGTPGVRYFDPLRDETVDVTEISGGNPDLGPQLGENRRLSLNLKPFPKLALQLYADYRGIRNRDIITALPPASDVIFAAFPERFIRDRSGVLTIVDVRPVSFARLSEDQLRYGFNLNLPLGSAASRRRSRLQLQAAHSLLLNSELLIRPGVDPVNLLSGEAIGLSTGSRIRHQFDFTLAYAERGLGVRLTGQHRGVSYLGLVSGETTDVLRFSPITTFNVRAFAEGQRLLTGGHWLKGSRLTLAIVNLTNRRQVVRDSSGATPLLYQKAYRDPLGRSVELEFRMTF